MWYMTEERELLRKMVAEFAENEVRPFVKEMEENETFPKHLIKRAGELGILGLCYPEEIGGASTDWINLGIALEEISKVSTTVGLLIMMSAVGASYPFYLNSTDEQKEKILKPTLRGDMVLPTALCEPAGSSMIPYWSTKAVPDGDDYIINGSKIFTTLAGQCEYYGVMTLTDEFNPATQEGATYFLIHKDNPGLKIGHIEHKLAWHGSSTGTIYLKDCRVHKDSNIGGLNKGMLAFTSSSMQTYSYLAVLSLGGAEGVYEKTLKYVKERMHGTGSLWQNYQAVRHRLANMRIELDACRGVLYSCFEAMNQGKFCLRECMSAKIFAQQVQESVASQAVLLHGGNGLMVENDVERYFRESKMLAVGGFSVDVIRDQINALM